MQRTDGNDPGLTPRERDLVEEIREIPDSSVPAPKGPSATPEPPAPDRVLPPPTGS
jgi:hypothetical protein